MDLSPEKIRWILVGLFTLIVSVALHEFGHAFMAYKLGDDTPKRQGRVTLNPIAHADPIGTILLPLIGSINAAVGGGGGGFGWGKPVQWQPHKVRRSISMATANILVSFAGPMMNVVLGTVISLTHIILVSQGVVPQYGQASEIFFYATGTNFVLFFFNLLPVPPLDGGHIAQAFMPYRHREKFDSYARFGPFVVLGFMLIPQFAKLFLIPAMWCTKLLYSGFGDLFGVTYNFK